MVLISEVEEKEIFKICLEYWNNLAAELYRENPFSSSFSALMVSEQGVPPRRQLYLPVLSKVCLLLAFAYEMSLSRYSCTRAWDKSF